IVNRMSARGYVQGRGAEFDPFTEVTRAEFAAMLVRLMDMNDYEGSDIFEDVNANNWFYDEVAAAYDLGLIEGVSATEFKPNENITREEMAVMASRMLKKKYYLESEEINFDFSDEEELSTWALEGTAMVEELEVMTGRTSGEFDPKGLTTRLEAVIVMERLLAK
ncbi:MAG: S-layer homology domain-containing protein, partial [Bacillota bacterium]|nr:S-layer homology domain-containing protein [Bacillota bacterium]